MNAHWGPLRPTQLPSGQRIASIVQMTGSSGSGVGAGTSASGVVVACGQTN
jgi:hypothetical protein